MQSNLPPEMGTGRECLIPGFPGSTLYVTCIIPEILGFSVKVLSKILTGTHHCIERHNISMNRGAIHDIEKLQGIFPSTTFETVEKFYCNGLLGFIGGMCPW